MNLLKKFFYMLIFISLIILARSNLIEFHMFELFILMPLLVYVNSKIINYNEKLMVNYFGIDVDLNEDKINYIKNIYEKKIKINSILILAMTPFVYYIEFFINPNYKVYNNFFLNRLLQGPFIFGAIILLGITPILVKKEYFKKIKA